MFAEFVFRRVDASSRYSPGNASFNSPDLRGALHLTSVFSDLLHEHLTADRYSKIEGFFS